MNLESTETTVNAKFIAAIDDVKDRMRELMDQKGAPTEMEELMGYWKELIEWTETPIAVKTHKLIEALKLEYDAVPIMETLPKLSIKIGFVLDAAKFLENFKQYRDGIPVRST